MIFFNSKKQKSRQNVLLIQIYSLLIIFISCKANIVENHFESAYSFYRKTDFYSSFSHLIKCVSTDTRCQNLLGEFYFLGLPPINYKDFPTAVILFKIAAEFGNSDAQYNLAIIYSNFFNLPRITTSAYDLLQSQKINDGDENNQNKSNNTETRNKMNVKKGFVKISPNGEVHIEDESLKIFYRDIVKAFYLNNLIFNNNSSSSSVLRYISYVTNSFKSLFKLNHKKDYYHFLHGFDISEVINSNETEIYKNLNINDYEFYLDEPIHPLLLYSSALSGNIGALIALGFNHEVGLHAPKNCNAASRYYLEVAKQTVQVYSNGIPQAIELIRLHFPGSTITDSEFDQIGRNKNQNDLLLHVATYGKDNKMRSIVGKLYLLGLGDFPQNYKLAHEFLLLASQDGHGEAMGYLAYIYALGLGLDKPDYEKAAYWFTRGAKEFSDPLCMNGMGWIHFFGIANNPVDRVAAFNYFNMSAYKGIADAEFNLGSMYLMGIGTFQSHIVASQWYTKAVEQGHTPAAYSLAIMYSSGFGITSDCQTASALLRGVAERSEWISEKLQNAYDFLQKKRYDEAAFIFLKLAEAGHKVSQINLAVLIESGQSDLFMTDVEEMKKIHAEKFLKMAANSGIIEAELKLGDYAYYGWGLAPQFYKDVEGSAMSNFDDTISRRKYFINDVNYPQAIAHYKKVIYSVNPGGEASHHAIRALYNLGCMYLNGIGVSQDFRLARNYFEKALEMETNLNVSLVISLLIVWIRESSASLEWKNFQEKILKDLRISGILMSIIILTILLFLRYYLRCVQEDQTDVGVATSLNEMNDDTKDSCGVDIIDENHDTLENDFSVKNGTHKSGDNYISLKKNS